MTVTGRHLPGTPTDILPAPRTLAALQARIETHRPQQPPSPAAGTAKTPRPAAQPRGGSGDEFFRKVNDRALQQLETWFFNRRLRSLLMMPLPLREGTRNELDPPSLCLSPEAWEVWRAYAQAIERECVKDGSCYPVRSAALKMGENIARIAGVLAIFEKPDILRDLDQAEVPGEIMAVACEIGGFYLTEAMRLIGHKIADPETVAVQELATWITDKWPDDLISPADIQQSAPRHLRTAAEGTRARIVALCEAGVLELVGEGEIKGRKRRETYRILRDGGRNGSPVH